MVRITLKGSFEPVKVALYGHLHMGHYVFPVGMERTSETRLMGPNNRKGRSQEQPFPGSGGSL